MFGVVDAEAAADLVHGADQRVELDRAAGVGVLQHRGPEAAELAGHRDPLLARLRDRAADARADLGRLRHPAQHEGTHQRVVEDGVAGRAGQRGDRVHRHVAPELVPDVAAHVGARFGLEACAGERRADRVDASRRAAGRLADDQPLAEAMPDDAGLGRRAGQVDDAAEHARERQARRAGGRPGRRSRAAARRASAAGMNHHGTPFIAGSTIGRRADQRRDRLGRAASAGALRAMTTSSCGPSARASSLTAIGSRTPPSAALDAQPVARAPRASVAPRASAETS